MNSFIEAYRDAVVTNYANFSGRVDVGRFWRFIAVNFVVTVVISFLSSNFGVLFYLLAFFYGAALIVPSIAAAVRRLHDTGKTGWLALIGLIPIFGTIVLIVLCVPQGDTEANEYGPPYVPY